MGQSGITSAVGLCLENAHKTVPVPAAGTAKTVGIPTTNPLRFMTVDPGGSFGASIDLEVPDDEIDGDGELGRTILTGKDYNGGFGFKLDPEVLQYILMGLYGADTQTTVQASNTTQSPAVYKHEFVYNTYAPSFTAEEIFGDGNNGRLTSGVLINELDLDFAATLRGRFGGGGYRQIPNEYRNSSGVDTVYDYTSTAAVYPDQMGGNGTNTLVRTAKGSRNYVDVASGNTGNGPLTWSSMVYGQQTGFSATFMKVNDVDVAASFLRGFGLGISRNIEKHWTGGSGADPGDCTANGFATVGKNFSILYKDNALPIALLRKSKVSFCWRFEGPLIGTSGIRYAMEIHLPRCRFQNVGVDIPASAMLLGGGFVCEKDKTLGYASKITLVNSFSNSGLGGGAGSTGAAGGIGGWNPNPV